MVAHRSAGKAVLLGLLVATMPIVDAAGAGAALSGFEWERLRRDHDKATANFAGCLKMFRKSVNAPVLCRKEAKAETDAAARMADRVWRQSSGAMAEDEAREVLSAMGVSEPSSAMVDIVTRVNDMILGARNGNKLSEKQQSQSRKDMHAAAEAVERVEEIRVASGLIVGASMAVDDKRAKSFFEDLAGSIEDRKVALERAALRNGAS